MERPLTPEAKLLTPEALKLKDELRKIERKF